MSNLITRRFALFRIASAGAATAVAAAPVAIAAIQPTSPESAELIGLGDEMTAAAQHFVFCDAARAAAKAECDRLWPLVPEELMVSLSTGGRTERDCDDKPLSQAIGGKLAYAHNYLDADMLQSEIDDLPGLDAEDNDEREWRLYRQTLLALAVDYDQRCAAALKATNYETVISAWYGAEFAVTQLLRRISATPAVTPLGITIKAQAYQASAALAKRGASRHRSTLARRSPMTSAGYSLKGKRYERHRRGVYPPGRNYRAGSSRRDRSAS